MTETEVIKVDVSKFGQTLEQLTPRDIVDFQRQTGISLAQALQEVGGASQNFELSETQALALAGLVWIVVRKDQPDFTFEQALDVPFTAITGGQGEDQVGFTQAQETLVQ